MGNTGKDQFVTSDSIERVPVDDAPQRQNAEMVAPRSVNIPKRRYGAETSDSIERVPEDSAPGTDAVRNTPADDATPFPGKSRTYDSSDSIERVPLASVRHRRDILREIDMEFKSVEMRGMESVLAEQQQQSIQREQGITTGPMAGPNSAVIATSSDLSGPDSGFTQTSGRRA